MLSLDVTLGLRGMYTPLPTASAFHYSSLAAST